MKALFWKIIEILFPMRKPADYNNSELWINPKRRSRM
jgi:hypothetical protein